MLRSLSLHYCVLREVLEAESQPGGADAEEMRARVCRWPFRECQSSCDKIGTTPVMGAIQLENPHVSCQGHCLSCLCSSLPVSVPIYTSIRHFQQKSGSVVESRCGQMNIDRTATAAACVARGQTEGQGLQGQPGQPGPGCKSRGLICRNRVQGSCDSRIPSRCASIVGVEELWRLHAASNNDCRTAATCTGCTNLLCPKCVAGELGKGHESMTKGRPQV